MLLPARAQQADLFFFFFFSDESTFKERHRRDVISQNVKTTLPHSPRLRSLASPLLNVRSLTGAFIQATLRQSIFIVDTQVMTAPDKRGRN